MKNQNELYTYQNGCIRNSDTMGAGEDSELQDQSLITRECTNDIITLETDWQVPKWQLSSDQEIAFLGVSLREMKQNLCMTL